MSRKKNSFNDNTTAGYDETDKKSSAELDGEVFDEDEETVDISQFAASHPHISAKSEEGKKVAQLMESLLLDSAAPAQSSKDLKQSKPPKEKKTQKGFGLFSPELPKDEENEYQFLEDAPLSPDIHNKKNSDESAQSEPTAAEDDYYYEDDYPDIESEQEAAEDYNIDNAHEFDEKLSSDTLDSESEAPEEAEKAASNQSPSENEDEEYAPSPYYSNSGKFINKHPFLKKLRAFWTSSEDFEEKFDDNFDPSVFDKDEPGGSHEQASDNAEEDAVSSEQSDENYDYADDYDEYEDELSEDVELESNKEDYILNDELQAEEISDEEDYLIDNELEDESDLDMNDEEYPEDEYEDEYEDEQSLNDEADAPQSYNEDDIEGEFEDELEDEFEYETALEDNPKKKSILDKFKSFWKGEDLSDEKLNEEVTDDDIAAELQADYEEDKAQWGKSSLTYDDLSEYAPKPRTNQDSVQAEAEEDLDENAIALEQRPRRNPLDTIKAKFKAILKPSVTATDRTDDEDYEEDIDLSADDEPKEEEENELQAVRSSKPSPIDHFKNFWNDDGDYADEEEDEEEDEPVDAEYNDEKTPVVTKPVLKVIHPFDKQDDESEEETKASSELSEQSKPEDKDENSAHQAATSDLRHEEDIPAQAQPIAQSIKEDIDSEEEDEIISEGPDAPDDVYSAPSHRARRNIFGVFGKLKAMWKGEAKPLDSKDAAESEEKHKFADKVRAEAQHTIDEELSQRSSDSDEHSAQALSSEAQPEPEVSSANDDAKTEPAPEAPPSIPAAEVEQSIKSGPEVPTFDDVAQNKTQIDNLDGKQVVDGKVIPDYIHEDLVEKINLTNENLSMVVRREYEEYIKQSKYKPKASEIVAPEVNSEVSRAVKQEMRAPEAAREQSKQKLERSAERAKQETADDKRPRRSLKDVLFGEVENSADFSEFRAQTNQNRQNEQVIEDYDKPSDARAIRAEINYDNRKISFRCIALTAIFLITLLLFIIQRYFPTVLTENIPNADIMTCLLSMILLLVSAVLCHSTVIGGLKPLLSFKGNSDTAISVAVLGCVIQGIVSFFEPQSFFSGGMHLYSILAIAALLLNSLGKMCIVQRIRDNFKFVSSPNRKYSARILDDEEIALEMISKTEAGNPVIALQSRTKFLKGFLRFSYMPDPSERAASIMAPITTVIAVLVAIICGISTSSPSASASAFSIVACMSVPMCCLLAINIPMKKLCKDALKSRAMIVGYPAVKHFSDTRAVMVDSRELYPRGRVELLSVKTFNTYNIDKALLNAAAVMKIANTPMTYMFEDVISEKGEQLPEVESVKYEDGKGLVSWVGGERLLLGTRELMIKYSINLPSVDFEESSVKSRTNCITYLANAGQLVAMLVTDYQPDRRLAAELKRLEDNGVTILIRTADPNVSQLKVAKDYRIYMRSIKILPTVLGNICKDEMSRRDESSRAVLATEGRLHSLARAIGGCIKVRSNLFISIIIQIIAVALGVLIASLVSLFSGLQGLSGLDLLLYVIFWTLATIIAPLIRKA